MLQPTTTPLTKEMLNSISPNEIIYAEFAELGAAGNAGGVLIYTFVGEQFRCFATSVLKNEDVYYRVIKILEKNQNIRTMSGLNETNLIFRHYYGGMGNNVYVNNDVKLIVADEYFIFTQSGRDYKVIPSVLGVFATVVHELEKPENGR